MSPILPRAIGPSISCDGCEITVAREYVAVDEGRAGDGRHVKRTMSRSVTSTFAMVAVERMRLRPLRKAPFFSFSVIFRFVRPVHAVELVGRRAFTALLSASSSGSKRGCTGGL